MVVTIVNCGTDGFVLHRDSFVSPFFGSRYDSNESIFRPFRMQLRTAENNYVNLRLSVHLLGTSEDPMWVGKWAGLAFPVLPRTTMMPLWVGRAEGNRSPILTQLSLSHCRRARLGFSLEIIRQRHEEKCQRKNYQQRGQLEAHCC